MGFLATTFVKQMKKNKIFPPNIRKTRRLGGCVRVHPQHLMSQIAVLLEKLTTGEKGGSKTKLKSRNFLIVKNTT
jgi:hypothetical protein